MSLIQGGETPMEVVNDDTTSHANLHAENVTTHDQQQTDFRSHNHNQTQQSGDQDQDGDQTQIRDDL